MARSHGHMVTVNLTGTPSVLVEASPSRVALVLTSLQNGNVWVTVGEPGPGQTGILLASGLFPLVINKANIGNAVQDKFFASTDPGNGTPYSFIEVTANED